MTELTQAEVTTYATLVVAVASILSAIFVGGSLRQNARARELEAYLYVRARLEGLFEKWHEDYCKREEEERWRWVSMQANAFELLGILVSSKVIRDSTLCGDFKQLLTKFYPLFEEVLPAAAEDPTRLTKLKALHEKWKGEVSA